MYNWAKSNLLDLLYWAKSAWVRAPLGVSLGVSISASVGASCLVIAQAAWGKENPYMGIGRLATSQEISAWDIDVRPDFKGLPKGSGSVAFGMQVWESKCESCHGIFGENNEVFSPLIGGTTKDDVLTGRVKRLNDPSFPGRTTMMKLSSVSTLWDYIYRAMPWNQPKSLSTEQVYAVTAYMLNMAGVLPDTFVLSDQNIGQVQQLLPNRNGMTTAHAMWPTSILSRIKPDARQPYCIKNCAVEAVIASFLPDFARDSHGNLADQNRLVGPQRGAVTVATSQLAASRLALPVADHNEPARASALALAQNKGCTACHGLDSKILGPSFSEIVKKYAGRNDAAIYIAAKVKNGSTGVWGAIPMPAQSLSLADAQVIADWIVSGASK